MNILAVGAHIGDAELMAGPLVIEEILTGGQASLLALTPGELGNAKSSPVDYKIQKIKEAKDFSAAIGARSIIFEDLRDGFLTTDDGVALRIAQIIRQDKPDLVLTHWIGSFHPDHRNAHTLVSRAIFLAQLPMANEQNPPHKPKLKFSENWEDLDGYKPSSHREISSQAFKIWTEAITGHEFARGKISGFRYIDYYTALLNLRGCLASVDRAVSLMDDPFFI